MSEERRLARTRHDNGGADSGDPRRNSETAGSDATSDGSNPPSGNSDHRQQGKWVGLALALATIVYTVAQLVGIVTGNSDKVEKLNDEINERARQRIAETQELLDTVNNVQERVNGIPTKAPIPPAIVIQPGKNGEPGKTIVIPPPPTPPLPRPTPTLTPAPTPIKPPPPCRIPLGRECIVP